MEEELGKPALFGVAAALLALLALTVGMSFVNLGMFSSTVTLAIAVAKALLVAYFFMELRGHPKLFWIIAAAGILWFLLLLGGTLADVLTRSIPKPPPL